MKCKLGLIIAVQMGLFRTSPIIPAREENVSDPMFEFP